METKKTTAAKRAAKKTTKVIEPFAELAEPPVDKKRVTKKAAAAGEPAIRRENSVRKVVNTAKAKIVLDPFAETVDKPAATSPVKKKSVRLGKAADGTIMAKSKKTSVKKPKPVELTDKKKESEPGTSAVIKILSEPELPELKRENRARLQMQTPTRLYFYWSVKENPWALLKNVFGSDLGSYTLVHKLVDKKHGREEIHQTDAQGNYWFNVEPDGSYQAEIGFYAPNRPYFRILFSNTVETPRRGPSPRSASEAKWTVSSAKFAEVLDVAGFSRDAFDVAMAGDDQTASETASFNALNEFLGRPVSERSGITPEDIRYALTALASGIALEDLRGKISAALFEILHANSGNAGSSEAIGALRENFDIDEADFEEEQLGPGVYGASLVHFPRTIRTRALSPKSGPRYNPVSSHSFH